MKKVSPFIICLLLTACSRPNVIEIPVSRSQIFYGQSMEDLYNNFGAPKKAARYSNDVIEYTFKDDSIVKEDWDRKVHFCDFKVYAKNNLVIDWCYEGNHCHIKEADILKYLDKHLEEQTIYYPEDKEFRY